jgi:hypothetical protein
VVIEAFDGPGGVVLEVIVASAQADQVVLVGAAAVGPGCEVVDLAVFALAVADGELAFAVAGGDELA